MRKDTYRKINMMVGKILKDFLAIVFAGWIWFYVIYPSIPDIWIFEKGFTQGALVLAFIGATYYHIERRVKWCAEYIRQEKNLK